MVQINKMNIQNFDEFAVKNVYSKLINNKLLMSYFPELGKNRWIDRSYFYDVLLTFYLDYVSNMVLAAYSKIYGNDAKPEDETIQVTPGLLTVIRKSNYILSNLALSYFDIEHKSRTIYLLKKNAKHDFKRKRRKHYELEIDPSTLNPTEENNNMY